MEPLPPPDLLVVGEVLADLISDESGLGPIASGTFRRMLGGSVANLAVAYARLGGQVAVVGCVGRGPTGAFVIDELRRHGVDPGRIRRSAQPTTIAFVERGTPTPAFEIVRGADRYIDRADLPDDLLTAVQVFHTSAFALSREPARWAILDAISLVRAHHGLVSLDLNYESSVWGGRAGRRILAGAVGGADLVKASCDDLARLFGGALIPERGAAILREWGARTVVITMGREGALFSTVGDTGHVPAVSAAMVDTTGAGDAFWAGVLRATILGADVRTAVVLGSHVAGRKIAVVGPLAVDVDATAFLASIADRR